MLVLKEVGIDVGQRLFINLPLLIAHIIVSVFLILILSYLVFKPFKKWLHRREKHLKDQVDESNKHLQESAFLKKEATNILQQKKLLAKNIVLETQKETDLERKQILQQAQDQGKAIVANSVFLAKKQKTLLKAEIEKSIILNALLLSKKIVKTEIDTKKHQQLIKEFIRTLEESDK